MSDPENTDIIITNPNDRMSEHVPIDIVKAFDSLKEILRKRDSNTFADLNTIRTVQQNQQSSISKIEYTLATITKQIEETTNVLKSRDIDRERLLKAEMEIFQVKKDYIELKEDVEEKVSDKRETHKINISLVIAIISFLGMVTQGLIALIGK